MGKFKEKEDKIPKRLLIGIPDGEWVRASLDGVDGAGSKPFLTAADRKGNRWRFAVAWATSGDLSGDVVVRAKGLNAEKVTKLGVVDNTDIYRIMYYTLFDRWLPAF